MRLLLTALSLLFAWNAQASSIKIVVNGREIQTSVIESNGVIYVPVDALARALGVAVTIQPGEVAAPIAPAPVAPIVTAPATPPAPAPPPAPEVPVEVTEPVTPPPPPTPPAPPATTPTTTVLLQTPRPSPVASIRGVLKYNLDVLNPHGPDVGAQVWLVPAAQVPTLAAAAGGTINEPIPKKATGWDKKLTDQFKFAQAVADARGEFSFSDVPPGSYTLVLLSKHVNSLAARDRHGKMRFKKIVVREGKTVDLSFGFGMGAFPMEDEATSKAKPGASQ